ncbi:rhomboid family intramembrane serine protease [Bacteroidia bacterium]|nr:rhomboid family intramembrane serine protease [Bacteroidia bacterium]GHV44527.1 rhomboid family intramembrane serine protease [Bacteroidia bacterium]
MNIIEYIKGQFRNGGAHISLIYINIAVFVMIKAVLLMCKLFLLDGLDVTEFAAMPSNISLLGAKFWTPITYMFFHENFWHILFNMLCLYWFGILFLQYFSGKQLISVYVFGGLLAAAFYLLSFNVLPYYQHHFPFGLLMGASGAIMAIIVAVAMWQPNAEIRLLFIGAVKLKFVAIAFILLSFFGLTSSNGGGEMAHLGGAAAGWLFAYRLKNKNKDITAWINRIIDWFATIFKPHTSKLKYTKPDFSRMSDAEFNMNKAQNSAEIDRILDKIKASGYESLTKDEKQFLFSQGKK